MTLSYTVDEVDFDHPECIGFVENVAEYEYYNDNGYEKDYENRRTSPFFVWKQKNKTDITVKEESDADILKKPAGEIAYDSLAGFFESCRVKKTCPGGF